MPRPPANPAVEGDNLIDTINEVHTEALNYADEVSSGTFTVSGTSFSDIQAQINAAAALGGGTVLLLTGLYTGNVRIELRDNVTIRGAGQGATILRALSGVAGGVITALSADTVVDAAVQDLTVDANTLAGINGIQLSTATRPVISRVTTINTAIGIWLNGSADCKVLNFLVSNASVQGVQTSSIRTLISGGNIDTVADTGITVTGAPDCRIESTRIASVGATGATKHGINIVAGSDRTQVHGCPRIAATGGMGIHVDASSGVEISNNTIDQSSATLEGIGLSATATDARVIANRVLNGKDNGISVSGARSIVTSNEVDGAQFMGIQVNGNDCVVNSNVIRNSGKSGGASAWAGIDLNNVQRCIVIGNRCFDDQGTQTQKYGIGERGTSDNNTIGGNDLTGNLTSAMTLVGLNTVILANQRTPTRNQAAPYTVSRNDEAYQLRITATGTITIPDAATLPHGFSIGFYQAVTGTVTITNAVAGQLKSRGTVFNLAGQYGVAWVTKDASGELVLAGDLA
jgi:hypothetical protein